MSTSVSRPRDAGAAFDSHFAMHRTRAASARGAFGRLRPHVNERGALRGGVRLCERSNSSWAATRVSCRRVASRKSHLPTYLAFESMRSSFETHAFA